jgi:hypothetical protein
MQALDELRLRPPVTADEMARIEGSRPTYILIEGVINSLAEAELRKGQGVFEKLGRQLGLIRDGLK